MRTYRRLPTRYSRTAENCYPAASDTTPSRRRKSARIPPMDWAGRTEDRGNAGETTDSFFHPSGPSEFGYLIWRKSLILHQKLARGADRTPFHPVNPGSDEVRDAT